MGTAALVGPWMTFHDEAGNQVIQGIGEEIVQRLKDLGGSPGHVRDTTGYVHTVTPFDPELAKMVYLDLCLESGVELLLHTWVTAALMEGWGHPGRAGMEQRRTAITLRPCGHRCHRGW